MKCVIAVLLIILPLSGFSQKLEVKIINRHDNETDYTYIVAGHSNSQSSANINCGVNSYNVNCAGSSTTYGFNTPAYQVPFHVRGSTLSLLLQDGRVAVVNCESKFAERMAGPRGNHRSCRVPLVDEIEVDFHGDKAKLEWNVSLDGKKRQSETYKILAVLDKPQDDKK